MNEQREALAEALAGHGVGQIVPLGDGGWDVRNVPPEVIATILDSPALARLLADAWGKGWEAGCNDQQYGDENAQPWTPNPYAAGDCAQLCTRVETQ